LDYYPEQTKLVRRACARLGLRFRDLDNGGGYLFSVSDGRHEMLAGTGSIPAYALNEAPAYGVSRDKAHTNAVLALHGVAHVPGDLYFLTERYAALRPKGRELADAVAAFARMEEPKFVKPNDGARGDLAEVIASPEAFARYVPRVAAHYDAILVQPVVEGDEYRVFCIDDRAVFATLKTDLELTGDGTSTLAALLRRHNSSMKSYSVSPLDEGGFLEYVRARLKLDAQFVPSKGQRVIVPGRRNLSAGGGVRGFWDQVPAPLAALALAATRAVSLRVSGVDIFELSPARDLSQLAVLEVNGNPSIATLGQIGRDDVADDIWTTVLSTWFRERR
jgi:glutathione synthase/RimK-type ligase-like ATP-grasp enzyme